MVTITRPKAKKVKATRAKKGSVTRAKGVKKAKIRTFVS